MFGIPPWRTLKRGLGVNKPGTDWFNAVTNALTQLTVRFGDEDTVGYIDRPNRDGSNWSIVLPGLLWYRKNFWVHPWKVTRSSDTQVDYAAGRVHGGNRQVSIAAGSISNITAKKYIYAQADLSTMTGSVTSSDTWPPSSTSTWTQFLIAIVNVETEDNETKVGEIEQVAFSDFIEFMADNSQSYGSSTLSSIERIGEATNDGAPKGIFSLFGFKTAAEHTVPVCDYSGDIHSLAWVGTDGTGGDCTAGGSGGAGTAGGAICTDGHTHAVSVSEASVAYATEAGSLVIDSETGKSTLKHDELLELEDDDHAQYWINSTGGVYNRNYGLSIGDSTGTLTINLDERKLTNGAWTCTDNFSSDADIACGSGDKFKNGTNDGATHASPLYLTNEAGDAIGPFYLRGGILCTS